MKKRTPTLKQIKTLQLVNQGYSVRRAMKEAGYSLGSLNKSHILFKKSPTVQRMMKDLNHKLYEKGYTTEFLADKFMEWINAEKPFSSHTEADKMIPDYDIQLKAYDRAKEIMNPEEQTKGIKRKLTLEEFITGEEEQSEG